MHEFMETIKNIFIWAIAIAIGFLMYPIIASIILFCLGGVIILGVALVVVAILKHDKQDFPKS